MAPELRKRKAPATEPTAAPPAKKNGAGAKAKKEVAKKASSAKSAVAKVVSKAKEVVAPKPEVEKEKKDTKEQPAKKAASAAAETGDIIDLEGFGGEVETNAGVKTTLQQLVDESKGGVVLFTYPKASTPGCTTQACLFRDSYEPLTATGFAIYGLSKDSPKANTTFKEKQKLPYPLLCDPSQTLISAIGFKKAPAGTTRGVFVVDKAGKILAKQAGGPAATVDVVKKLVGDAKAPVIEEKAEAKTEVAASNGADEKTETEAAPTTNGVAPADGSVPEVAASQ